MADAETADLAPAQAEAAETECGIIMPIAEMPSYPAAHWEAMKELISRSVRRAGMVPVPVWENGAADVLQERIVRNLYEQPYAVCDVSGLNPNVMLELGLRLAFGKPTIIINDGAVRAPFDIGPAEYVVYDRSLHFQTAEDFVRRLSDKIGTVKTLVDQETYRPYIKTFGPIELGTPGNEAVPLGQAVLDQMSSIAADVRALKSILPTASQDALGSVKIGSTLRKLTAANELSKGLSFEVSPGALEEAVRVILVRYPEASVQGSVLGNRILVNLPNMAPAERHRIRYDIEAIISEAENNAVIG